MSIQDPSDYKTGAAVPSNKAMDLNDNAKVFDVFQNANIPFVVSRLGKTIKTIYGNQQDIDSKIAGWEVSINSQFIYKNGGAWADAPDQITDEYKLTYWTITRSDGQEEGYAVKGSVTLPITKPVSPINDENWFLATSVNLTQMRTESFEVAGYSYQGQWLPNIQIPAKADRVDGYALWEPTSGKIITPKIDSQFDTGATFDDDFSNGKFNDLVVCTITGVKDVLYFGAKYDSSSDETSPIKSAMNDAKTTELLIKHQPSTMIVKPGSGFIPLEKTIKGIRNKTVIKRADSSPGNMAIFRDNVSLEDIIIDGNKAGNNSGGVSLRAESRTGIGLRNVSLINAGGSASGDGLYAKDVTSSIFENVIAVGNGRNGASFVDNCENLSFRGWRTKDNGLVGLDLEPNSTVQSNISIVDFQSENDGLSIQGGASTAYNSKITLDNIRILNGSLLNINRAVGINGGTIYVDFSSEITIEKQATQIYGLTDGNVNIIKEGVPLNGQSKVVNGSFNGAGSGWSTVKNGSSVVEFVKQQNAIFGEYVLHTNVSNGEYGQAKSQEFSVVATQYFCCGCHIRAVSGRPYLNLRFKKANGDIISQHKLAGPVNPENRFRRPFMMFRVPDDAVKADILCGGDATEDSEGYFDGVFYYQNSTKSLYDPSDNDINKVTHFGSTPPTSGSFEAGWTHYPVTYVESGGKPVLCWKRKTTGSDHVVGTDWIAVISA